MTTINNQDDFLEALRNNPQWRDAVRAQILGEDLLKLPVKFDAFARDQNTRATNLEERVGRIERYRHPQGGLRQDSSHPGCPGG